MAALASDWMRHFLLLLWNYWMEFNETWQEARFQHPLPFLCSSGRSEKQDGRPGLWFAENILDFSSGTAEWNSTKHDRKQDLNVLYQACVFRADRKSKMAAMVSNWLRHFRLLLWNRWTEFKETWQEARFQHRLPCLCFSGQSEKRRWPPWPLNGWGIFDFFFETAEWKSKKLDRKQDLNVLYQFLLLFFGPIGKTRWPPRPLICWDIFYFSSGTAEWNSTKHDRKQDLNVLYQVCVFQADK